MRVPLLLLAFLAPLAATPLAAQQLPGASFEGRADAPVRVVEYLSFTCPHCAEQEAAVDAPLEALVARGAVSVETRHALRDVIDLGVATLARCQGPAATPGNRRALFAAQGEWLPRAAATIEANRAALVALPPVDAHLSLMKGSGVLPLMAARGLTETQARACLSDPAEQAALMAQTEEAWTTRAIPGTPYTLVNDKPVDGHDWPTLKAAIQAAAEKGR